MAVTFFSLHYSQYNLYICESDAGIKILAVHILSSAVMTLIFGKLVDGIYLIRWKLELCGDVDACRDHLWLMAGYHGYAAVHDATCLVKCQVLREKCLQTRTPF